MLNGEDTNKKSGYLFPEDIGGQASHKGVCSIEWKLDKLAKERDIKFATPVLYSSTR